MAKQLGIQIKGSIDGYSFYHDSRYGYLVRKTGGLTSKQYHTDNRYAAARDASSEFSNVSRAGKLIRKAFGEFAQLVKDGTMVNRLNKELVALKQLDNRHVRGNRKPQTMMADPEANKWLRIFQFNEKAKLYDLMECGYNLQKCRDASAPPRRTSAEDHVHQINLKPETFPEGASHAGLTLVRTIIDFENNCFQTNSSRMALVSADNQREISLTMPACPSGKGIEILCLQVVFFEEQNGNLVQLKGQVHAMGILEIAAAEQGIHTKQDSYKSRFKRRRIEPRKTSCRRVVHEYRSVRQRAGLITRTCKQSSDKCIKDVADAIRDYH